MPELPEVETLRRDLRDLLPGRIITGVTLLFDGFVKYPQSDAFSRLLKGKGILGTGRKGKYLFLSLSGGFFLVVHLRMTGRLLYYTVNTPPALHTRGVFHFATGDQLHFHDVRKFGTMWLVKGDEWDVIGGLKELGPEPWEGQFSPSFLHLQCSGTKRSIKSLLLSQKAVAGVGNIYADEALYLAGIHPGRRADSLGPGEATKLWSSIRKVLQDGIEARGTSMKDYLDARGRSGSYQKHLRVYGRREKQCSLCRSAIERMKVAGRSSFYCPGCQKD